MRKREGRREGGEPKVGEAGELGKRALWTRQASQPVTPSYACLPELRSRKVKGWRPRRRDAPAPSAQLGNYWPMKREYALSHLVTP